MRSQHTLIIVMLVFCIVSTAFGADIYVSPTGNDAAAGTITAPLATLAAARDKADIVKAGNTPVTVYLRGVTYYLSAPLVFGRANGGTINNIGSDKGMITWAMWHAGGMDVHSINAAM